MRSFTLALIVVMAATLWAPSAQAAHEDPCRDSEGALLLETEQAFVKATANRVGNLAALGQGAFPAWGPGHPTQPGVGGVYVVNRGTAPNDARIGATFEGTFSGCLDTIAMELYATESWDRVFPAGGSFDGSKMRPYVTINSRPVYDNDVALGTLLSRTPDPTGIPGTVRYRVAFTGIHEKLRAAGMPVGGTHVIRLSFSPQFLNSSNVAFLYDGASAPTNVTFNGATEGHTVLAANRP